MSDSLYPTYQHYGTAAERAAFTPDPPTNFQPIYIWYETDTGDAYLYHNAAWVLIVSGGTPAESISQFLLMGA